MKKVAIVGVEGSGKTVMLAGLGDLYTYPDEGGYFLAPKNFETAAYVAEKMARMRKGEWPMATTGDEMQGLDWTLKRRTADVKGRPESICEVSFLDFAGEVYRAAYGISRGGDASLKEQAEALKQYVCGADGLIVLINLRDVITNGIRDTRVQEAMWITKSILDTALGDESGKAAPRAAIALSQVDSYAETIKACGSAAGVLQRYLPHVANDYGWLDIFTVSAVDKTTLDDDGNVVPAADFTTQGLLPIMQWIRGEDCVGRGTTVLPSAVPAGGGVSRPTESNTVSKADDGHAKVQLWAGGPYWATTNIGAEKPWKVGCYFWWGDTVGHRRENNVWVANGGPSSNFTFSSDSTPTYGKDVLSLQRGGWLTAGNVLAPGHDAAQVLWGGGWRMPTCQEFADLVNKCDWTWTTQNGVNGYVVCGRGDYASSSIFLPAAGYGYGSSLNSVGSLGNYRSSVPASDSVLAYGLNFRSSGCSTYIDRRFYGQSVRPVQGFAP